MGKPAVLYTHMPWNLCAEIVYGRGAIGRCCPATGPFMILAIYVRLRATGPDRMASYDQINILTAICRA